MGFNTEEIFLVLSFVIFLMMIGWKLIAAPAIRDRKVLKLAKESKSSAPPVEVIVHLIMLPMKGELRRSDTNFDIEAAGKHYYFTVCSFWTPPVVTQLEDGDRGVMYISPTKEFTACCIEARGQQLLGTLSSEIKRREV